MSTAPHDLTVEDAEALARRVPQIRRTAPVALGTANASYGERSRDVTVIGTTPDMLDIRKLDDGDRPLPPRRRATTRPSA